MMISAFTALLVTVHTVVVTLLVTVHYWFLCTLCCIRGKIGGSSCAVGLTGSTGLLMYLCVHVPEDALADTPSDSWGTGGKPRRSQILPQAWSSALEQLLQISFHERRMEQLSFSLFDEKLQAVCNRILWWPLAWDCLIISLPQNGSCCRSVTAELASPSLLCSVVLTRKGAFLRADFQSFIWLLPVGWVVSAYCAYEGGVSEEILLYFLSPPAA